MSRERSKSLFSNKIHKNNLFGKNETYFIWGHLWRNPAKGNTSSVKIGCRRANIPKIKLAPSNEAIFGKFTLMHPILTLYFDKDHQLFAKMLCTYFKELKNATM